MLESKDFLARWLRLGDLTEVLKVSPDPYKDPDNYLRDLIINEPDVNLAEKRLKTLERLVIQDKEELKRIEQERNRKEANVKRLQYLQQTDWTQLADVPLTTTQRNEYREYRQYLRDHFEVYERKQILQIQPLSFSEWQNKKPIYKVSK